MKYSKSEMKRIAKIYAACQIENALGSGAYSALFNADQLEDLGNELNKIARRISNTRGYISLGELDDIIKAVKEGEY